MKIAYEVHPVSPERKKELREKGFRIVDARFAPKDAPEPVLDDDDSDDEDFLSGNEDRVGLSLDSDDRDADEGAAAEYTDEQLRDAIEQATGDKPHHRLGREKLVAQFNELSA